MKMTIMLFRIKLLTLLLFCFNSLSSRDIIDTTKARLPNKIQSFYIKLDSENTNYKDAKSFLLKKHNLSIKTNDDTLRLISSYELSSYYYQHRKLGTDSAKYYALICKRLFSQINLPEKEIHNNNLLAILYSADNKYDSSLFFCDKSEKIIEKYNHINTRPINSHYGIKFHVLIELMEYEKALNLMSKIEYYAKKSNESHDFVKLELVKAKLYKEAGDNNKQIIHLQNALNLYDGKELNKFTLYNMLGQAFEKIDIDSSVFYYNQCLKLSDTKLNYYANSIQFQLANVFIDNNFFNESKFHFEQIDTNKIKEELPCEFLFLKAKLNKDLEVKESLCLRSIECSSSLKFKKDIYEYLSLIYRDKETKFFVYTGKYNIVKDSLAINERKAEMQRSILRKELNIKNKLLDNSKESLEKEKKRTADYLIGIVILILLLVVAFLFFKKQKNKKKHILEEKKKLVKDIEKKNKSLENACLSIEKNIKFIERTQKNINEGVGELTNLKSEINIYLQEIKSNKEFNNSIESVENEFFKSLGIEFTPTERRIIMLLKIDLSSKEIAKVLDVKISSVDKYRYNIRKKLNLSSKDSLKNKIKEL